MKLRCRSACGHCGGAVASSRAPGMRCTSQDARRCIGGGAHWQGGALAACSAGGCAGGGGRGSGAGGACHSHCCSGGGDHAHARGTLCCAGSALCGWLPATAQRECVASDPLDPCALMAECRRLSAALGRASRSCATSFRNCSISVL